MYVCMHSFYICMLTFICMYLLTSLCVYMYACIYKYKQKPLRIILNGMKGFRTVFPNVCHFGIMCQFWYVDYFELKGIKVLQAQETLLSLP